MATIGKQDGNKNRQLRAVPDHDAERGNDSEHVAYRDRDDAGYRLGDHLDVVGHPRQQRPGRLRVEKTRRQCQELAENAAPQVTDHLPPDPAQRGLGCKSGHTAQDEDPHERDTVSTCRLELLRHQRFIRQRLPAETSPASTAAVEAMPTTAIKPISLCGVT